MNKDIYTAQENTWARTSDRQLDVYFRDPENFHSGMRVTAVIYAVGRYDDEVDWDRGNWIYEWRRKTIRIRVATCAGYITEIDLVSPGLAKFDDPLETLWRNAEYFRNIQKSQAPAENTENP